MTVQLTAKKRTKKSKHLRREGMIPAVLYGRDTPAESLVLAYNAFAKVYVQAGESTLVDLLLDDASPCKVLIHDVQQDPITNRFAHVDLYQVRMTDKMKAHVLLKFVGTTKAVKDLGGMLVKNLKDIAVSCLPQDLVHEITIDLGRLENLGDSIYVKDITPPPGITILEKPDEPLVTVMRPKTEEELAKELAEETPKAVADVVKVKEKEKKEGDDEGVSAEAPPAATVKDELKKAKKESKR